QVAGISQNNPKAFLTNGLPPCPSTGACSESGTYAQRDFRGGVRTTGEFDINRDWSFGWDGLLQTDRTFTRNYHVLDAEGSEAISNIHLTGIGDRSYFDARAMYFQILTDLPHLPDASGPLSGLNPADPFNLP